MTRKRHVSGVKIQQNGTIGFDPQPNVSGASPSLTHTRIPIPFREDSGDRANTHGITLQCFVWGHVLFSGTMSYVQDRESSPFHGDQRRGLAYCSDEPCQQKDSLVAKSANHFRRLAKSETLSFVTKMATKPPNKWLKSETERHEVRIQ